MPRSPKDATKPARAVEALRHADARRNIPTAEFQSIARQMEESAPAKPARFPRATPLPHGETRARNADLDPQIIWRGARIRITDEQKQQLLLSGEIELGDAQLVWRGKDEQDWSDLVVNPPPIYIQEKVHPKAIIDGLRKEARTNSAKKAATAASDTPDLFADFNGLDDPEARLEFYQHDQHWSNRMILGDSLQVMASLAEREGLRGKVQCIYLDPPYGIKFNSNWQVSTLSRDVKDGKREDVSREPEQVKAFRDTWKEGIHSYLTYLRDRLTVARELLTESGSVFVQIGSENGHRVRIMMDEVFGHDNLVSQIVFRKTTGAGSPSCYVDALPQTCDYLLWFCKKNGAFKHRRQFAQRSVSEDDNLRWVEDERGFRRRMTNEEISDPDRLPSGLDPFRPNPLTSQTAGATTLFDVNHQSTTFRPGRGGWKTSSEGMHRLSAADRLYGSGVEVST